MKLTVLGCDGTFPDAYGACSGYLLTSKEGNLQLDMGCGVLPRLMAQMKPENLSAIFITHWHYDHVSDLLALKYYLKLKGMHMRLFAPMAPQPFLDLLLGDEFLMEEFATKRHIAGFDVTAIAVNHPLPAYALRFERNGKAFVYTGDAVGSPQLAAFCQGADLLLCDATFTKAQWHEGLPHFSAAQAGQLAQEARVKQLILTHLQPGSDKDLLLMEARAEFEHTLLAHIGLQLAL
ncbi:MAG: MBL fold metallo-hydrolase [Clostridiales bacterium]|nr:MBL fold metallo-hydrolase [Clostridiales bacterium]